MIFGNGVDILEINRIDKIVKRHPRFIERNFSVQEQAMFAAKDFQIETIAVNFAAKEAISKAFGTGIRGFSFNEIEVLRDGLGRPYVVLKGRAQALAEKLGIDQVMISLSHSDEHAIAFAIAVGRTAGIQ